MINYKEQFTKFVKDGRITKSNNSFKIKLLFSFLSIFQEATSRQE